MLRNLKSPRRRMRITPISLDSAESGKFAEATLDLATDIVLTKVVKGVNTGTFELVVEAAAANPTDTVLVAFTGTASAIVCTVTPNNGDNNGTTPVDLDEDELAELINTGAVVGKTITLTDASSLRALQTATGGASSALSSSDDQTESFASGVDADLELGEGKYVASVEVGSDADGHYLITLTKPHGRSPVVVASPLTADVIVKLEAVSQTQIELKCFDATDGTTAKDSLLHIVCLGSEIADET